MVFDILNYPLNQSRSAIYRSISNDSVPNVPVDKTKLYLPPEESTLSSLSIDSLPTSATIKYSENIWNNPYDNPFSPIAGITTALGSSSQRVQVGQGIYSNMVALDTSDDHQYEPFVARIEKKIWSKALEEEQVIKKLALCKYMLINNKSFLADIAKQQKTVSGDVVIPWKKWKIRPDNVTRFLDREFNRFLNGSSSQKSAIPLLLEKAGYEFPPGPYSNAEVKKRVMNLVRTMRSELTDCAKYFKLFLQDYYGFEYPDGDAWFTMANIESEGYMENMLENQRIISAEEIRKISLLGISIKDFEKLGKFNNKDEFVFNTTSPARFYKLVQELVAGRDVSAHSNHLSLIRKLMNLWFDASAELESPRKFVTEAVVDKRKKIIKEKLISLKKWPTFENPEFVKHFQEISEMVMNNSDNLLKIGSVYRGTRTTWLRRNRYEKTARVILRKFTKGKKISKSDREFAYKMASLFHGWNSHLAIIMKGTQEEILSVPEDIRYRTIGDVINYNYAENIHNMPAYTLDINFDVIPEGAVKIRVGDSGLFVDINEKVIKKSELLDRLPISCERLKVYLLKNSELVPAEILDIDFLIEAEIISADEVDTARELLAELSKRAVDIKIDDHQKVTISGRFMSDHYVSSSRKYNFHLAHATERKLKSGDKLLYSITALEKPSEKWMELENMVSSVFKGENVRFEETPDNFSFSQWLTSKGYKEGSQEYDKAIQIYYHLFNLKLKMAPNKLLPVIDKQNVAEIFNRMTNVLEAEGHRAIHFRKGETFLHFKSRVLNFLLQDELNEWTAQKLLLVMKHMPPLFDKIMKENEASYIARAYGDFDKADDFVLERSGTVFLHDNYLSTLSDVLKKSLRKPIGKIKELESDLIKCSRDVMPKKESLLGSYGVAHAAPFEHQQTNGFIEKLFPFSVDEMMEIGIDPLTVLLTINIFREESLDGWKRQLLEKTGYFIDKVRGFFFQKGFFEKEAYYVSSLSKTQIHKETARQVLGSIIDKIEFIRENVPLMYSKHFIEIESDLNALINDEESFKDASKSLFQKKHELKLKQKFFLTANQEQYQTAEYQKVAQACDVLVNEIDRLKREVASYNANLRAFLNSEKFTKIAVLMTAESLIQNNSQVNNLISSIGLDPQSPIVKIFFASNFYNLGLRLGKISLVANDLLRVAEGLGCLKNGEGKYQLEIDKKIKEKNSLSDYLASLSYPMQVMHSTGFDIPSAPDNDISLLDVAKQMAGKYDKGSIYRELTHKTANVVFNNLIGLFEKNSESLTVQEQKILTALGSCRVSYYENGENKNKKGIDKLDITNLREQLKNQSDGNFLMTIRTESGSFQPKYPRYDVLMRTLRNVCGLKSTFSFNQLRNIDPESAILFGTYGKDVLAPMLSSHSPFLFTSSQTILDEMQPFRFAKNEDPYLHFMLTDNDSVPSHPQEFLSQMLGPFSRGNIWENMAEVAGLSPKIMQRSSYLHNKTNYFSPKLAFVQRVGNDILKITAQNLISMLHHEDMTENREYIHPQNAVTFEWLDFSKGTPVWVYLTGIFYLSKDGSMRVKGIDSQGKKVKAWSSIYDFFEEAVNGARSYVINYKRRSGSMSEAEAMRKAPSFRMCVARADHSVQKTNVFYDSIKTVEKPGFIMGNKIQFKQGVKARILSLFNYETGKPPVVKYDSYTDSRTKVSNRSFDIKGVVRFTEPSDTKGAKRELVIKANDEEEQINTDDYYAVISHDKKDLLVKIEEKELQQPIGSLNSRDGFTELNMSDYVGKIILGEPVPDQFTFDRPANVYKLAHPYVYDDKYFDNNTPVKGREMTVRGLFVKGDTYYLKSEIIKDGESVPVLVKLKEGLIKHNDLDGYREIENLAEYKVKAKFGSPIPENLDVSKSDVFYRVVDGKVIEENSFNSLVHKANSSFKVIGILEKEGELFVKTTVDFQGKSQDVLVKYSRNMIRSHSLSDFKVAGTPEELEKVLEQNGHGLIQINRSANVYRLDYPYKMYADPDINKAAKMKGQTIKVEKVLERNKTLYIQTTLDINGEETPVLVKYSKGMVNQKHRVYAEQKVDDQALSSVIKKVIGVPPFKRIPFNGPAKVFVLDDGKLIDNEAVNTQTLISRGSHAVQDVFTKNGRVYIKSQTEDGRAIAIRVPFSAYSSKSVIASYDEKKKFVDS